MVATTFRLKDCAGGNNGSTTTIGGCCWGFFVVVGLFLQYMVAFKGLSDLVCTMKWATSIQT